MKMRFEVRPQVNFYQTTVIRSAYHPWNLLKMHFAKCICKMHFANAFCKCMLQTYLQNATARGIDNLLSLILCSVTCQGQR